MELKPQHYPDMPTAISLACDPKKLFAGPHGVNERRTAETHPTFAPVTDAAHNLANCCEALARAFNNPQIGLVRDLKKAEPGVVENARGGPSFEKGPFGPISHN